ncbi:MAG TPA: ABC transporter permease [Pseudogracilibacillus sp.]|nr:ABC transporter permease [Pseudogracilibacillus sp.]
MTFRQFAFNNVFRNKRLYIAYFLSSLFTVTVFFTFANFAFHPAFIDGNIRSDVMKGMSVAGAIIYIFSFFFILYSMSSFLQSRKKEFGILVIQGMSSRQIRKMVFLENMLIGLFATLFGIGLGVVFSKAILLVAENVLVLDAALSFYLPWQAVLITFVSFIVLFFFISIFVTFVLRTNKLTKLIKSEKMGKSEPKFSIILVLFSIILLAIGYGVSVTVKGTGVIVALVPVVFIVTIGTYLFFTQLSVFVIRRLKMKKSLFWKKTNMILFSDLSYRMKDNARVFFMVAIISTVAFTAIGTLVSLNTVLTKGMIESNPTSFSYAGFEDEPKEEALEDGEKIEAIFKDHQLTLDRVEAELNYYSFTNGEQESVLIIKESDYNTYADFNNYETVEVAQGEAIEPKVNEYYYSPQLDEIVFADSELTLPVKRNVESVLPQVMPATAYYIVSDETYEQLPNPMESRYIIDWNVRDGAEDDVIAAGEELEEKFLYNVTAIDFMVYSVKMIYSPIMLVGLFIGVIFFVSAGSFLYFRLYQDLEEDKQKFRAISKIGLTAKEMRQVISRQTAILFFTPIVVALAHGAIALTALSRFFDYNLTQDAIIVLSGFAIIQIVYYLIVRYFYTKQIENAVR